MKKILNYLIIGIGITLIIIGLYISINIYYICTIQNGIMYDGFGYPYSNGEPSSPYTIYIYIGFACGISLIEYGRNRIKEFNASKEENLKEIISEDNDISDKTYIILRNILVGIIILMILGIIGYFIYDEIEVVESYKHEISRLEKLVEEKNKTIREDNEKIKTLEKNEKQVEFMDKYVAICPIDGTKLYHKYDCTKYDKSCSFYIFSIADVKNKGYKPCQYCENDNDIKEVNEKIVYITNGGTKYHNSWCSYLKSSNPITKDKAIEEGYTACSRCNP